MFIFLISQIKFLFALIKNKSCLKYIKLSCNLAVNIIQPFPNHKQIKVFICRYNQLNELASSRLCWLCIKKRKNHLSWVQILILLGFAQEIKFLADGKLDQIWTFVWSKYTKDFKSLKEIFWMRFSIYLNFKQLLRQHRIIKLHSWGSHQDQPADIDIIGVILHQMKFRNFQIQAKLLQPKL